MKIRGTGFAKLLKIERFIDLFKLKIEYITFKKSLVLQNKNRYNPKIFVIGLNKTGTTTIYTALKELGFKLGEQKIAEYLTRDLLYKNDYKRLFNYCNSAQAFQDIPFSLPNFYKKLDLKFPNSKFILSIRDSPEQWLESMNNFYSFVTKSTTKKPTSKSLKECGYIYKGFLYDVFNHFYPSETMFSNQYKEVYSNHISDVKSYFQYKQNQLLILNVADEDSYFKLCDFLEMLPIKASFSCENSSKDFVKID